jgi:hypothetical protein
LATFTIAGPDAAGAGADIVGASVAAGAAVGGASVGAGIAVGAWAAGGSVGAAAGAACGAQALTARVRAANNATNNCLDFMCSLSFNVCDLFLLEISTCPI